MQKSIYSKLGTAVRGGRLFPALGILLLLTTSAWAGHPKLAKDLDGWHNPNEKIDVIVKFTRPPDAELLRRLGYKGAERRKSFDWLRAGLVRIKYKDLLLLADDPGVQFISPDREVRLSGTSLIDNPDYGWMTVLGLAASTDTLPYDGTGVGVAVIDSGIADRRDLFDAAGRSRVVYRESFLPGDASTADESGHGTHVAGILAGNGMQSMGTRFDYCVRGIAPKVQLIGLRALDKTGAGSDSMVIAAIQRAIELKTKFNIRVLNLSLGRPVYSSYVDDPLCQAVEQAWKAGIVVVVAAGNEGRNNSAGTDGYATIMAPGNSPWVITVGAMNTAGTLSRADDKITTYSSKGPSLFDHVIKPDIVAPGNRIFSLRDSGSTLDGQFADNRVPIFSYGLGSSLGTPDYFELSGTSMATPMVSGAAALLLQQNPALTPDQVKARLMKTASKFPATTVTTTDPATGVQYTSQYDVFTIGAGYLDVKAALANTDLATQTAQSPIAAFDSATGKVYLVGDSAAVWGSTAVWGSVAVWGSTAVWGNVAVWGSTAVWGNMAVWGSVAVWGSSGFPYGFTAVWGDAAVWGTTGTVYADAMRILAKGDN